MTPDPMVRWVVQVFGQGGECCDDIPVWFQGIVGICMVIFPLLFELEDDGFVVHEMLAFGDDRDAGELT